MYKQKSLKIVVLLTFLSEPTIKVQSAKFPVRKSSMLLFNSATSAASMVKVGFVSFAKDSSATPTFFFKYHRGTLNHLFNKMFVLITYCGKSIYSANVEENCRHNNKIILHGVNPCRQLLRRKHFDETKRGKLIFYDTAQPPLTMSALIRMNLKVNKRNTNRKKSFFVTIYK